MQKCGGFIVVNIVLCYTTSMTFLSKNCFICPTNDIKRLALPNHTLSGFFPLTLFLMAVLLNSSKNIFKDKSVFKLSLSV